MFKPQTPEDDAKVKNECSKRAIPIGYGDQSFTGGVEIDQYGRWGANVYAQNANVYSAIKKSYQQADGRDMKLKHFNSEELDFQTLSTRAVVFASVLANQTPGTNEYMVARTNLKTIAWSNLDAICTAISLTDNVAEQGILSLVLNGLL